MLGPNGGGQKQIGAGQSGHERSWRRKMLARITNVKTALVPSPLGAME